MTCHLWLRGGVVACGRKCDLLDHVYAVTVATTTCADCLRVAAPQMELAL
jgi:hypothetical protein